MRDMLYKALGRASLCFDCIRPLLASKNKRDGDSNEFDKTGLVVREPLDLKVLWNKEGIIFAMYDSFAHSFWRAQEFSLFSMHNEFFKRPLLDFGCGDGSFASVLFKEIDYGADNDAEALAVAERCKIYGRLLQSSVSSIPLRNASVQTVISNSVLEHLADLDGMLSEISRILAEGGLFIFTVPVVRFKYDLEKYFGKRAGESVNAEYFHRNLLEIESWERRLKESGFSVVKLIQYQPDWFTFWYRMFRLLGQRSGLGRFFPGIGMEVFRRYESEIIEMIKESINETRRGANIFVIARKNNENH